MSKRFCDTDLWDKEWFMQLKPTYKCLIKFLWDKCDSAGVWSANWMLASSYVGEPVGEKDLIKFGDRIVKIAAGKFFCAEFLEFQYGTLSENCKPHLKILQLLKKYQIEFDQTKGYLYPIHRVKEKEEEKDKEEERKIEGENYFFDEGCAAVNPQNLINVGSVDLNITTEDWGNGFEKIKNIPFDFFWNEYDKKVGKDETKRQWDRLSDQDKKNALLYIPKYKKATPEKKFRKDPERFLKKRAWTNEVIGDVTVDTQKPKPGKAEATIISHQATSSYWAQMKLEEEQNAG